MGFYIAPYEASTIYSITTAISQFPQGVGLMVVVDFNTDLIDPEVNIRDKEIMASLATARMEDTGDHLLPQFKPWLRGRRMCSMICGGREVQSYIYYLIGKELCMFQNMSFQDTYHNIDHYLVLGFLLRASATEHSCYLGLQWRFSLQLPQSLIVLDRLFADLQSLIPKT